MTETSPAMAPDPGLSLDHRRRRAALHTGRCALYPLWAPGSGRSGRSPRARPRRGSAGHWWCRSPGAAGRRSSGSGNLIHLGPRTRSAVRGLWAMTWPAQAPLGRQRRQHTGGLQLRREPEGPAVLDPVRVEHPVKVVALVLHHPRMETIDAAVDPVPLPVEALVADPLPARHQPPHPRDAEATLPATAAVRAQGGPGGGGKG